MEGKELEGKNYLVLYYKNPGPKYPVISIVGTLFIRENAYKFHLILDGEKILLDEPTLQLNENQTNKNEIKIILVEDKTMKDMKCMFECCHSLKKISSESKWDCQNVLYIERMFFECTSLNYIAPTLEFTSLL